MNEYILIIIFTTFFSSVSQVLLKQSANKKHKNFLFEYLNWRVGIAYFIFGMVLILNTYAYTRVEMKYGAVLDSLTYVFVMILSYFILKEKFSKKRLIGNIMIILGIIVYVL